MTILMSFSYGLCLIITLYLSYGIEVMFQNHVFQLLWDFHLAYLKGWIKFWSFFCLGHMKNIVYAI